MTVRELDRRVGDGLVIRLMWDEDQGGQPWVEVVDRRTQGRTVVAVPEGTKASAVFQHPFAFAGVPVVAEVLS